MNDEADSTEMEEIVSRVVARVDRDLLGKVTDTFSIQRMTSLAASIDSALYCTERMSKAVPMKDKLDLLRDAMQRRTVDGLILEFGVASGFTINHIAALTDQCVYGFDTFTGLPEDWRPGFPRGAFSVAGLPEVRPNVRLLTGMFEQTLPTFAQNHKEPISFLHIDCDLYSSTKTIFQNVGPRIVEGTVIVFDEYFNYPGWREHEFRAFQEFVTAYKVIYDYLAFVDSHQQVAVRIAGTNHLEPATGRNVAFRDRLLRNLIEHSRFSFSRTDGTVLSEGLRLLSDGSILGYSHPNEATWAIEGEGLIFKSLSGETRTVFDKVEYVEEGSVALLGRFVETVDAGYVHRLTTGQTAVKEFASVVSGKPQTIGPTASTVVLVRTYECNEKYHDLMSKLSAERKDFDLYAIVDETRGRRDSGQWPAIWDSVSAYNLLGLTQQHPNVLEFCGDFPLYFALREIPEYQHYIMIEDDVEFCDGNATFISELCSSIHDCTQREIDFAGIYFQPDPGLIWGTASAKAFSQKYCYVARLPLVIVSKRLSAYLFSQRLLEAARHPPRDELMHCEVFVPSAAMAGSFNCYDVGNLIPGCYDRSIMMLDVPGYGRPMGAIFNGADGIRVYHPVYTSEEWTRRMTRQFSEASPESEERLSAVLEALVQEETTARAIGDLVMTDAIVRFRETLDPEWQRRFEALVQTMS